MIVDFASNNNAEGIVLRDVSSITSFNDLINNHMSQVGADVVIDAGGGHTITVLNSKYRRHELWGFIF